jgi:uncharacterized protein YukE
MAGILADPDAIAGLGAAFLDASDRLDRDAANPPWLTETSFGRLSGSWEAYQRYEQQQAAASADLRRLVTALRQFGDNLRAVVHNYAEADQASG